MQISTIAKYYHDSETVSEVLSYLISQFKPTPKETLNITEIEDLNDYGNEYAFLLKFNPDPENKDDDMTEEIPAYIHDMPAICKLSESDFLVTASYDYTNNHHFILLTFSK